MKYSNLITRAVLVLLPLGLSSFDIPKQDGREPIILCGGCAGEHSEVDGAAGCALEPNMGMILEVINGSGGCKDYLVEEIRECLPEFGNSICKFTVTREIIGGSGHTFTTIVGDGAGSNTTQEVPFDGGNAPNKTVEIGCGEDSVKVVMSAKLGACGDVALSTTLS